MFGIMKPGNNCQVDDCSSPEAVYLHNRKHYCGTCKTIGNDYGASARLLLNYDTVFLAELLSDLAGEETDNWQKAYQAINQCFQLPDKNKERPLSLRYAAAVNVFLGELKIEDNLQDEAKLKWKIAEKALHTSFQKARTQLEAFGVDTNYFDQQSKLQQKKEETAKSNFDSITTTLIYYADTTANMTSVIFGSAAALVDQPESRTALEILGIKFGHLIYTLDALEDLVKDQKKGNFNPIHLYNEGQKEKLSNSLPKVIDHLYQLQNELEVQFLKLPISEQRQQVYISRLALNLSIRLQKVTDRLNDAQKTAPSFIEKVKNRWITARSKAIEMLCTQQGQPRAWQTQLLTFSIFIAPQTMEQQGVGVGGQSVRNILILLGAILGGFITSLAFKPIQAIFAKQESVNPRKNPRKKRKGWWKRLFRRKRKPNDCCDDCEDCLKTLLYIFITLCVISIVILLLFLFYPANPTMWISLLFIGIALAIIYIGFLIIVALASGDITAGAGLGGFIVALTLFAWALGTFFFSLNFLLFLLVFSIMLAIGIAAAFLIAYLVEGEISPEAIGGILLAALFALVLGLAIFGFVVLLTIIPVWISILLIVLVCIGIPLLFVLLANA